MGLGAAVAAACGREAVQCRSLKFSAPAGDWPVNNPCGGRGDLEMPGLPRALRELQVQRCLGKVDARPGCQC